MTRSATAWRIAQPSSSICKQSEERHSPEYGRNSTKHNARSSGAIFKVANARMPAESASQPPPDQPYSCEPAVVCFPFPVASLTRPVLMAIPGSMAFTSEDVPTPDGPLKSVVYSFSLERKLSMHSPVFVLVHRTVYPRLL